MPTRKRYHSPASKARGKSPSSKKVSARKAQTKKVVRKLHTKKVVRKAHTKKVVRKVKRNRGPNLISFGNIEQKLLGKFDARRFFEDGELKADMPERLAKIVSRIHAKKEKNQYFRIRMGSDTSWFIGDRSKPDYEKSLHSLMFNFFNTLEGSDLGYKLNSFPMIQVWSFRNKMETKQHQKAIVKKIEWKKAHRKSFHRKAGDRKVQKYWRTYKAQWRKRNGRH